tara:strand:- start:11643 stop:12173 length:531 start_codon:yes stop_codon:yes gene_type:complete
MRLLSMTIVTFLMTFSTAYGIDTQIMFDGSVRYCAGEADLQYSSENAYRVNALSTIDRGDTQSVSLEIEFLRCAKRDGGYGFVSVSPFEPVYDDYFQTKTVVKELKMISFDESNQKIAETEISADQSLHRLVIELPTPVSDSDHFYVSLRELVEVQQGEKAIDLRNNYGTYRINLR